MLKKRGCVGMRARTAQRVRPMTPHTSVGGGKGVAGALHEAHGLGGRLQHGRAAGMGQGDRVRNTGRKARLPTHPRPTHAPAPAAPAPAAMRVVPPAPPSAGPAPPSASSAATFSAPAALLAEDLPQYRPAISAQQRGAGQHSSMGFPLDEKEQQGRGRFAAYLTCGTMPATAGARHQAAVCVQDQRQQAAQLQTHLRLPGSPLDCGCDEAG